MRQFHDIAKVCLQDIRLEESFEEYDSGMPRWRAFWNLRAIKLPNSASEMSDCGTLGKLKAMILSQYASKMLRWRAFWKLDTIILPKYASKMSDWKSPEKLKAMILSEMPPGCCVGGLFGNPGL